MIKFEWNPSKSRLNERKHGVTFEEAKSVFYDDFARQYFDDDHSVDEDRFILLGMSIRSRILIVCHCERSDGSVIRIISARKASRAERRNYQGPKK